MIRRAAPLLLAVVLAGCAHAGSMTQPLGVEVIPAGTFADDGFLEVRLTNTSGEEQCVFRDGIETPTSSYLFTELRVDRRRLPNPDGYIVPPRIAGMRRLAPDEALTFRVDMRGRLEPARHAGRGKVFLRVRLDSYSCVSSPVVGGGRPNWSRWTALPEGSRTAPVP